jgi:hypothetical protein
MAKKLQMVLLFVSETWRRCGLFGKQREKREKREIQEEAHVASRCACHSLANKLSACRPGRNETMTRMKSETETSSTAQMSSIRVCVGVFQNLLAAVIALANVHFYQQWPLMSMIALTGG